MNKKIVLLLILAVTLFSRCVDTQVKMFSAKDLPSSFYNIDVTHDTVVHTQKGALIKIPKGALNAGSATTVQLEVKEAYTITDIIKAGLTTKSGKQLLSSGGMIFINPAEKNVKITQAISISIPTDKQVPGMQLFKGEVGKDGNIDWTDPKPLPTQTLSTHLQKGKALFLDNCNSCHDPLKDRTGPALAFLDKHRHREWLYEYVRNSAKMIAEGNPLANCIYDRYCKTAMSAFPTLTNEDIQAIFDYVDDISGVDPYAGWDFQAAFDSCQIYNKLKAVATMKRNALIYDSSNYSINYTRSYSGTLSQPTIVSDKSLVSPTYSGGAYYQFDIESSGWYNVDIFTKGLPGYEPSELIVNVSEDLPQMNFYLVMPEQKIFVQGGLLAEENNKYGFYEDNGKIPLPQGSQGYILGMGELDGKLYFGIVNFKTTLKEELEIKMTVVTKDEMNTSISKLNLTDLNIATKDTKNANEIRKTDLEISDIEKLKPRGIDCNCGVISEVSDSVATVHDYNMR